VFSHTELLQSPNVILAHSLTGGSVLPGFDVSLKELFAEAWPGSGRQQ
jgi:hypothetical protein